MISLWLIGKPVRAKLIDCPFSVFVRGQNVRDIFVKFLFITVEAVNLEVVEAFERGIRHGRPDHTRESRDSKLGNFCPKISLVFQAPSRVRRSACQSLTCHSIRKTPKELCDTLKALARSPLWNLAEFPLQTRKSFKNFQSLPTRSP